jgi:hypothetical protein
MLRLDPEPTAEADSTKMEDLWRQYERRILWKKNQIESIAHDELCRDKCVCRTRQEEIHEWEDFAMQNFDKPIMAIEWNDAPEVKAPPEKDPARVLAALGIRARRV